MTNTPKHYQFLKTAQGSHDGLTVATFNRGETHELADDLAEQFMHQGLVKPTAKKASDATATPVSKPGEAGVPPATQHVEELVSVARDTYGLDVDSTTGEDELRAAIERAEADPENRETKVTAPAEAKPAKPVATKAKKAHAGKTKH